MAGRNDEHKVGQRFAGSVEANMHLKEGPRVRQAICVYHIYSLEVTDEVCPDCGNQHGGVDAGRVALTVRGGSKDGSRVESMVYISADEALGLAFMLQRVVGWIADSVGDTPDIERKAAKFEDPS